MSGLNRGLVYYYAKKRPEILFEKKRSKLPPHIIEYIYREAANKKISEINGRVLAEKVNKKLIKDNILDKKGKQLSISKSQINRILRQKFGKPRQIKKVFYLNKNHYEKRVKFCKKLLKMKFKGKNFFFTDETKIDLDPPNDQIRLGPKKKKK